MAFLTPQSCGLLPLVQTGQMSFSSAIEGAITVLPSCDRDAIVPT